MARIQILTLPYRTGGEIAEEPFALIIDQAGDEFGEITTEVDAQLQKFRADCGAVAGLILSGRLDVATDTEPEATSPAKAVDEYIQNVMGREVVRTITFPPAADLPEWERDLLDRRASRPLTPKRMSVWLANPGASLPTDAKTALPGDYWPMGLADDIPAGTPQWQDFSEAGQFVLVLHRQDDLPVLSDGPHVLVMESDVASNPVRNVFPQAHLRWIETSDDDVLFSVDARPDKAGVFCHTFHSVEP